MFRVGKLVLSSFFLLTFLVGCSDNNVDKHTDTNKAEAKTPSKTDMKKSLSDYEDELLYNLKRVSTEWSDIINSDELNPQKMMMSRYDDYMRTDLTKKIHSSQHQLKMYSGEIAKLEIPKSLPKEDQDTMQNAIITLSNSFGTMNEILTELQDIGTSKDKYEQEIAFENINKLTDQLNGNQSEFEKTLNVVNQKYGMDDFTFFKN